MTLALEAFSGVVDTYLLYLFSSGFYSQYKGPKSRRNFLYFGIYLVILSCLPLSGVYRMLLSWGAIGFLCFKTYIGSAIKAVLLSTAFMTLAVLIDIVCEYPFFLLGISRDSILSSGLGRCIFIVFAKLVFSLVIVLIVAFFGKKGLLDIPFRDLLPLATCQIVSTFICIVMLELVEKVSHFFLVLLTLSVIGILGINIIFFAYMKFIRLSYEAIQRKQLAEQQLNAQIAYYEQLKQSQEQTRKMWHDIKKQLTAVTALLQGNCNEQAGTYLDQIVQSYQDISRIADFDHPVVNAILNPALQMANAQGVTLQMDVFVSPSMSFSPLDLSVILGNTLDNAIFACSALPAGMPRVIELKLRQKEQVLYYQIANPYDPNSTPTARPGVHGYGLKNVTECVEKNHGILHIDRSNGRFVVEILLNL